MTQLVRRAPGHYDWPSAQYLDGAPRIEVKRHEYDGHRPGTVGRRAWWILVDGRPLRARDGSPIERHRLADIREALENPRIVRTILRQATPPTRDIEWLTALVSGTSYDVEIHGDRIFLIDRDGHDEVVADLPLDDEAKSTLLEALAAAS